MALLVPMTDRILYSFLFYRIRRLTSIRNGFPTFSVTYNRASFPLREVKWKSNSGAIQSSQRSRVCKVCSISLGLPHPYPCAPKLLWNLALPLRVFKSGFPPYHEGIRKAHLRPLKVKGLLPLLRKNRPSSFHSTPLFPSKGEIEWVIRTISDSVRMGTPCQFPYSI